MILFIDSLDILEGIYSIFSRFQYTELDYFIHQKVCRDQWRNLYDVNLPKLRLIGIIHHRHIGVRLENCELMRTTTLLLHNCWALEGMF